ncbi:hypothetical protein PG995_007590 [Apiospora arundinis]
MWKNATMVNYAIAPKQTDYIFGLTEPHTAAFAGVSTTSVPSSRSTHGASDASSSAQNTDGPTISVTTAGTSRSSVIGDTCPSTSNVALGVGLGTGLGVPLLVLSAVLLWMLAKQRYHGQVMTRISAQVGDTGQVEKTTTEHEPDNLQYEYVGGMHKWEKPQLDGRECRMIAELR